MRIPCLVRLRHELETIAKTKKDDPRGPRYTIYGVAADGVTPVGCAGRFTETGRYLIITVYEVTD